MVAKLSPARDEEEGLFCRMWDVVCLYGWRIDLIALLGFHKV